MQSHDTLLNGCELTRLVYVVKRLAMAGAAMKLNWVVMVRWSTMLAWLSSCEDLRSRTITSSRQSCYSAVMLHVIWGQTQVRAPDEALHIITQAKRLCTVQQIQQEVPVWYGIYEHDHQSRHDVTRKIQIAGELQLSNVPVKFRRQGR